MRKTLFFGIVAATVLAIALWGVCLRAEHGRLGAARAFLDDGVVRAVVLGDSVARGEGDERGHGIAGYLEARLRSGGIRAASVLNLGINGARTLNVRRLLESQVVRQEIRKADVLIVSIGGNDLYGDPVARAISGVLPAVQRWRTTHRIASLVSVLRRTNPAARIYLVGLYNPYGTSGLRAWLDMQVNLWDSGLIARFAAANDLTVIRICDLLARPDRISPIDRFHPAASGYEAIAARIAASLVP